MRRMNSIAYLSLVSLLGALTTACGASDESSEAGGSAQTVRPTQGPMTLLVTVPPGSAVTPLLKVWSQQPDVTDIRDPKDIVVNTTTQLPVGKYCMAVTVPTSDGGKHTFKELCNIEIKQSGGTTVALGAVDIRRQSTEVVLGVDMPFEIQQGMGGMQQDLAVGLSKTPGIVPCPEGKHFLGPWFIETVGSAQTSVRHIDSPDDRYSLKIVPPNPSTRALPDVPKEFGLRLGTYAYNFSGRIHAGTAQPIAITEGMTRVEKTLFYAVAPGLGWPNDLHSQKRKIAVFGTNVPENRTASFLDTGATLGTPEIHTFVRLDVNDVDFTMSDGSKRTVRGTFSVRVASSLVKLVHGAPTGAGIDLPAGKYAVEVTYKNPISNADSTFKEDVTLQ